MPICAKIYKCDSPWPLICTLLLGKNAQHWHFFVVAWQLEQMCRAECIRLYAEMIAHPQVSIMTDDKKEWVNFLRFGSQKVRWTQLEPHTQCETTLKPMEGKRFFFLCPFPRFIISMLSFKMGMWELFCRDLTHVNGRKGWTTNITLKGS